MMTKMERAKEAIEAVFGDTSKPPEETRADLTELKDDIDTCINAIDEL